MNESTEKNMDDWFEKHVKDQLQEAALFLNWATSNQFIYQSDDYYENPHTLERVTFDQLFERYKNETKQNDNSKL